MRRDLVVFAMICLLGVNGVIRASGPDASLPQNLVVAAALSRAVEDMRQSSPTFRRQCRRLRDAASLRVNLVLDALNRRPSHRARADMKYRNGRLLSVDIHLTTLDDSIEFIAHDEHVIEQLDAVDLDAQTRTGTVWKREDGAFETRRAIEIGKRVAREVSLLSATSRPPAMPRPSAWPPFRVVPQQYALASFTIRALVASAPMVTMSSLRPMPASSLRTGTGCGTSTRSMCRRRPSRSKRPAPADARPTARASIPTSAVMVDTSCSSQPRTTSPTSNRGRAVVKSTGEIARQASPGCSRPHRPERQRMGSARLRRSAVTAERRSSFQRRPTCSAKKGRAARGSASTEIDLSSNKRSRVDVTGDGRGHSGQSASPAISGDGRYIAFATDADATTGGAAGQRSSSRQERSVRHLRQRRAPSRQTRRVSVASTGSDSDGPSYQPSISIDGRYVAFVSEASNLTVARHTSHAQVFVRDMETGTIEMVSHTSVGGPGNAPSARPAMAGDGSRIAYRIPRLESPLPETVPGGGLRGQPAVGRLAYDRNARHTMRASADEPEEWMESSRGPSLDEKGTVLTFSSVHQSSPEDEAHDEDLFIVVSSGRREQPTENSRSASHRRRRAPRRRSAYTAAISRSSAVSVGHSLTHRTEMAICFSPWG